MNRNIINPLTGRKIAVNKGVYKKLLRDGYVYDSETNSMIKPKQENPPILDEIPATATLPPTKLKNKKVKKPGEIPNWLSKIITNRTDIDDDKYWMINIPQPESTVDISRLIDAEREKHGKENVSKNIKRKYYNNIRSLDDIHDALIKTYENEKEAFWLHFSLGSVAEQFIEKEDGEREYSVKLFPASQNNFYDDPISI